VSDAVRDAIHHSLLVEPPDADARPTSPAFPVVATQLAALMRASEPGSLSHAELALLQEWLARLSQM
jgi:hypothetical protein